MGIDLYFSGESLENCRYALCRKLRKKPIQVVYNDEEKEKEWWQYRNIKRTNYRDEDITLPEGDQDHAYEYRMKKITKEEPDEIAENLSGLFKVFSGRDEY